MANSHRILPPRSCLKKAQQEEVNGSGWFWEVNMMPAGRDASNNGIAQKAKERIRLDPHLTMQRIWCEYCSGRLYLQGQVPSFYHKQLAQEAIVGMQGIDQVVNEIEVVW